MRLESFAATDVGRVRQVNQDRVHIQGNVAAVADGMGGHVGGERAAAVAVEQFKTLTADNPVDLLVPVIQAANENVIEVALEEGLQGMGTTVVALGLDASQAMIRMVNVGDSRGYLLREGQLTQVTQDHSLVQDLVRAGKLSADDAELHPQRNIVTRALGIEPYLEIDTFDIPVKADDLFLLCSDGLSNEMTSDRIAELLSAGTDLETIATSLIEGAVDNGGRDNVTVALVRVEGEDGDSFDSAGSDDNGDRFAGATVLVGNDRDGNPVTAEHPIVPDVVYPPDDEDYEVQVHHTTDRTAADQTGSASPPAAAVVDETPINEMTPGGGGASAGAPARSGRRRRSRASKFTFFFTLLAVVAVAFGSANYYGRNAWFADAPNGQVSIYQGRPGGFLWIAPEQITTTELLSSELDSQGKELLESKQTWNSISAAEGFVNCLPRIDGSTGPLCSTADAGTADAGG